MQKTILLTGSTDGIGLAAAKVLLAQGHHVIVHGRSPQKVDRVQSALSEISGGGRISTEIADLSSLAVVRALAEGVADKHPKLDVVINNAGVYKVPDTTTGDGLDTRFVVNTIAPYYLTKLLIPRLGPEGRVINVSSAAQAPVDLRALAGDVELSDNSAYGQSKLALTMWSCALGQAQKNGGTMIVAVNPGSMLGSKMVKQAFGVAGADLSIGAKILARAALDEAFSSAGGTYFDNDHHRFAPPHPDALDANKCEAVINAIEAILPH